MNRLVKILKYTMIILFSVLAALSLVAFIYLQQPLFGKAASGERLERMKQSKNYRDGAFVNRSSTPTLTEGYSMSAVMFDFIFRGSDRKKPSKPIPHIQTNLKELPADSNLLVWFGHSS